jgi:quercetin dioxygenase-like cupin family protein
MKLAGAFFCGVLLCITVPAMAEDAPRSYEASPQIYKVIAQNGPIHVIMATWKPGQRDAWHSHPAAGVYFLTDCQEYVYLPNGTRVDSIHKAGEAIVNPPIASHSVENTAASECRLVIVERD